MATTTGDVAEDTVAEYTRNVFGQFKAVKKLENDMSASWQEIAADGLSRFQLWASNLGAYHDAQDPRSADFRLRKAPEVQERIIRLLQELLEDLDEIHNILSGQREGEVENSDDPEVPRNSDGEAEPRSEVSELWLMVDNDITSLMKVSVLVHKNTVRNKLQHAVRAAEKMSSSSMPTMWDRQRICHWYPKLEQTGWLLERLARATTQRRAFLMYAEGHSLRIAHDSSGNFGSKSLFSRPTQALTKAPTLGPGEIQSTALEQLDHFEDDDDMSEMSATTRGSQLDGQNHMRDLNLLPLSSVCKEDKPGICPYCYDAVLFVGQKKRKLWRRHAFSDLMAYSCTFECCDRGLFGSLSEWATHEKTEHLRDWHCPICNRSCDSRSLVMAHISNSHPSPEKALSFGQINDVSPPTMFMAAARCPFCNELDLSERIPSLSDSDTRQSFVEIDVYQRHLSRHMEQLALLAKSASVEDDEVSDNSDVEKVSQAASSDMTHLSIGPKMVDPTASEDLDEASGGPGIHTRAADSDWDFTPSVPPLRKTLSNHSVEEDVVDTPDYRQAFESRSSSAREDPTDLGSKTRDVRHYVSHESRDSRLDDDLVNELAEMRLERRNRASSRGRREASSTDARGRGDYYRHAWNDLEREERRHRETMEKMDDLEKMDDSEIKAGLESLKALLKQQEEQRIARDEALKPASDRPTTYSKDRGSTRTSSSITQSPHPRYPPQASPPPAPKEEREKEVTKEVVIENKDDSWIKAEINVLRAMLEQQEEQRIARDEALKAEVEAIKAEAAAKKAKEEREALKKEEIAAASVAAKEAAE